ncbi:hypothetical protein [Natronococcus wangiae]|nr:hypothetical protein [Natronococcus sp. AD5]
MSSGDDRTSSSTDGLERRRARFLCSSRRPTALPPESSTGVVAS